PRPHPSPSPLEPPSPRHWQATPSPTRPAFAPPPSAGDPALLATPSAPRILFRCSSAARPRHGKASETPPARHPLRPAGSATDQTPPETSTWIAAPPSPRTAHPASRPRRIVVPRPPRMRPKPQPEHPSCLFPHCLIISPYYSSIHKTTAIGERFTFICGSSPPTSYPVA